MDPVVLVYCHLASTLCQAMDSEPCKRSSGWALSPVPSDWAASQMITGHIFTEITLLPPRSTRCTSQGLLEYLSCCIHVWTRHRTWGSVCVLSRSVVSICNPTDCSPPGCSVRLWELEWVAISFSRGHSQPRDQTLISHIGRQILYHWATKEALCGSVCSGPKAGMPSSFCATWGHPVMWGTSPPQPASSPSQKPSQSPSLPPVPDI